MLFLQPFQTTHHKAVTATRWLSRPTTRRIAIVLFDGCDLFGAATLAEALALAGELGATDPARCSWQTSMVSANGGKVKGSSALQVWTEKADAQQYAGFDAVFVAAGEQETVGRELAPMNPWLDRVRANATPLTSLGSQRCVSHGEVGRAPPSPTHGDRHVTTGICASASPVAPFHDGLVAALMLISREAGECIARHVAEHFPIASRTALASVLDDVSASTPADKVREAARWLQDNCHRPVSVADVANVAAMSERSLLRHFRQEIGVSPSDYLLQARLARACRLLVDTDLPVDKIARRAGMSNGDHLARVFRRHLRLSPLEYRHRVRDDAPDARAVGLTAVPTAVQADGPDMARLADAGLQELQRCA